MRTHTMGGFQMASTCPACAGQGVATPRGGECGTCRGDGAVRERKTVTVDIPGGVEDGMRLRVTGEGDAPVAGQSPGARKAKGDLYVFIRVATDPKFNRQGSDILYTASIPVTTAVLGGEIRVPTLDGEVRVKVPTGTAAGDKITLGGLGMNKLQGRRGAKGDLRVEFKVQMPKYLSNNQRTILEMLAEEMGDKTARRVMNIPPKGSGSAASQGEGDHQNEGWIKNAWHNLTGQHKNSKPDEPGETTKDEKKNEEPKKASGSS